MKNYRKYLGIFYILAAFIIIPIYNKGTFDNLSQHKVEAFYLVNILFFIAYFVLGIISDIRKKNEDKLKNSTPSKDGASKDAQKTLDIAMGIYIFANFLSLLFSKNIENAFYGVPGFGMGFLSILLMGISYFYISRNVNLTEPVIHIIALSSLLPTLLTIINRLGYDPLKMFNEGEYIRTHLYVSTIGNYSAFCAYMGIIIPIVCFMTFFAEKKTVRCIYGAFLALDIISIIMAGTSAIRIVTVFAFLLVLFWKIAPQLHIYQGVIIAVCVLFFLCYALFVSIGITNPDFANGRGFIWELTREMFRSFSIKQKIIGVGTNCYMYSLSDFLMKSPKYLEACNERFGNLALTSSHSEYLDYLINSGIIGLFSYGYVIYAALKTYSEKENANKFFRLSFLCIVCYLLIVTVNFSNVLSTPFFFIFLGTLGYGKRALDR